MMQIARTATGGTNEARDESRDLSTVFYEEYPRLWSIAFAMLGDAHLAEEVVMETFVKAFSSWTRLRRLDYPPAYLKKVVLNLCRSKLRRRSIEMRVNALAHGADQRHGDAWEQSGSDIRLDVLDALAELSPMQRACVVLRYFDDMTDRQVAETLDCSVGTVKSHIFRARKALGKTFELEMEDRDE
jgi:RNA polymerase sigma-70 factor (sigma-E family)